MMMMRRSMRLATGRAAAATTAAKLPLSRVSNNSVVARCFAQNNNSCRCRSSSCCLKAPFVLDLNRSTPERMSLVAWTLPVPPLVKASPQNLGFRRHHLPTNHFSSSSPSIRSRSSSSWSEEKGGGTLSAPFSSSSSSSSSSSASSGGSSSEMGCDNDKSPPPLSPSPPLHYQASSKFLTLPTMLTLGRVAAVPLLINTFYVDSWWGTTATTSIFIAAAITDWLDGYIARKMRLGTAFGAFLDPVADKLMVAATLVLLCSKPSEVGTFGQVPWLLTVPAIAIIGREITMSAVREWAASQNTKLLEAVAVNNLGKWKTATQMTALTILLVTRDSSLAGPGVLVVSGLILLYVSAGLSLWSLAVYMKKIWKVLLR